MQTDDGSAEQSWPEKKTIRFRGPKTDDDADNRRIESVDLSHHKSGLSNGQEKEEGRKKQGACRYIYAYACDRGEKKKTSTQDDRARLFMTR